MTPYFLPDPQIQWALNLPTLRGVDVKIITPEKPRQDYSIDPLVLAVSKNFRRCDLSKYL
jgi:phosphatidylserine/phosphatidylglycerophosphate/cardiolipin synthase-like enzyme